MPLFQRPCEIYRYATLNTGLLNDLNTRYVYFAEGPKQALGYGLGSASQYLHPAPLLPALLKSMPI